MTHLVVVDTETSGLDVTRHHIWEAAAMVVVDGEVKSKHEWWLETDMSTADSNALRMNRYYERLAQQPPDFVATHRMTAARELAVMLGQPGAHLVGLNPAFDAGFIDKLLREQGHAPAHHYHLVDVEALIAGAAGLEPPWSSSELSKAIGVEPPPAEVKHTAAGDRDWTWQLYQAWQATAATKGATKVAKKAAAKRAPAGPPPPIAPDRPAPTDAGSMDDEPEPGPGPGDDPAVTGRPRGMPPADENTVCEECGDEITGEQAQKSWTRWRAVLCPDHFRARSIRKAT
jgi:hypothetical protein